MKITGARVIIECLVEQGIDTVFGYPGGAILNVYDELYKNKDRIKHVLTAHEQGASHAADGYSRATGKTGVVLATSGPGATNLVTGIATAYMDSIPMVAITCNVTTPLLGKDSFQEIDITGVTMPITKHSYIVRNIDQLAGAIREAFFIAKSGRPGPVLIDVPKDVTASVTDFEPLTKEELANFDTIHLLKNIKRINAGKTYKDSQVEEVAKLINSAVRPYIYAGGGIISSGACEEVKTFAEKANIPVGVSLMAKTAFPANHPLSTGMIGMHGTKASNTAINKADLVVVLGARFSDRVISDPKKFAVNTKFIHIDIDSAEINKNIKTCASIVGDLKDILTKLIPLVNERKASEWNEYVSELKNHIPPMYNKKTALHPKFVCEKVNQIAGEDAIITTEVGQHQMWVAQFYPFSKPRTLLTSGGLGTMGYGTGAAIGAQTAFPERTVVHFAGDGSFRMNCNELATIQNYNLPIIIIVVNNGVLGMVRQWQNLFYEKRFSETTLDRGPDFVKLAEAYGIQGFRVKNEEEFESVFKTAFESRKPTIIDCNMNIDEMVLPMVPAGKPIDELLLEVE